MGFPVKFSVIALALKYTTTELEVWDTQVDGSQHCIMCPTVGEDIIN